MKRIFTLFLLVALGIQLNASQKDSIITGAGYSQDVYYSLKTGTVATVARANWDIAFTTNKMSSSILVNDGSGVSLYAYGSGDTSAWSSVDTTGFSSWTPLYNSEESWEEGAFGTNSTGHPDYGWGIYNTVTHNLKGDSLFVLKNTSGFYKIWIVSKQSAANIFTFRFAKLDNSFDTTIVLDCNPYMSKNFVYYHLASKTVLDREPAKDSWDLLFTKYMAMQPQGSYYSVTGVLQNNAVEIGKMELVDTALTDWSSATFSDVKSVIGWNWKTFNMSTFSYEITDSLVHIVKTVDEDVYKLVFTGFAGSSTGKVFFTKAKLSGVGFETIQANGFVSDIYPNPAEREIRIDFKKSMDAQVQIYDLSGKLALKTQVTGQQNNINIQSLTSGLYIIKVQSSEGSVSQKLIVR